MRKKIISYIACAILGLNICGCTNTVSVDEFQKKVIQSMTEESDSEIREEEEKTEVSEERTVDTQEWKEAYILQANEIDTTSESGLLAGYLVDVDLDGIPELIAYSSDDGDMYTYENGQLVALGYSAAYVTERYYQQGNVLIAESHGLDILTGMVITLAKKENDTLLEAIYRFYWDEEMNPIVGVCNDENEEAIMIDYQEAISEMEACGIHIAYEYNEIEHCLEYSTVIDDSSELVYLDDLEAVIDGIRNW